MLNLTKIYGETLNRDQVRQSEILPGEAVRAIIP